MEMFWNYTTTFIVGGLVTFFVSCGVLLYFIRKDEKPKQILKQGTYTYVNAVGETLVAIQPHDYYDPR